MYYHLSASIQQEGSCSSGSSSSGGGGAVAVAAVLVCIMSSPVHVEPLRCQVSAGRPEHQVVLSRLEHNKVPAQQMCIAGHASHTAAATAA
jgi:hypothetical protein